MPGETSAALIKCGRNCRVSNDQTESYLCATRSQPSCSKRVNGSSIVANCRAGAPPAKPDGNRCGCPTILLERKLDWFFFFARNQFISLDHSRARIPTQDRIVVTGRTNRFGSFEPAHCLT